jgi:hypothetical protein
VPESHEKTVIMAYAERGASVLHYADRLPTIRDLQRTLCSCAASGTRLLRQCAVTSAHLGIAPAARTPVRSIPKSSFKLLAAGIHFCAAVSVLMKKVRETSYDKHPPVAKLLSRNMCKSGTHFTTITRGRKYHQLPSGMYE